MPNDDHWPLYPDIQAAGGLAAALDSEFARLGVVLEVLGFGAGSWARVEAGTRSCQLVLAAQERRIMTDFTADGVGMGNAAASDLSALADSVAAWLTDGVSIAAMKYRSAIFEASDGAEEFEQGHGVDHARAKMEGWVARDLPRLTPLVEAAKRRPELRQLLPFTSHDFLCFSRCTGYPYTNDVAHAVPLGDGRYRALGPGYRMVKKTHQVEPTGEDNHYEEADYDVLGEGDAEHVSGLIVQQLPEGCGPAIRGTAREMGTAGSG